MRKCPNCGKEVKENDKFCGWCGKKLPLVLTEEEKKQVQEIKERAKKEDEKIKKEKEGEKEDQKVNIIRERAKEKEQEQEKQKTRKEKITEKLTEMSPEEEERRNRFMEMLGTKKTESKEKTPPPIKAKDEKVIFRPVLQTKPSPFEKIWTRLVLFIFLISITGAVVIFGFDVLGLRGDNEEPATTTQPTENGEPPVEEPGEISIPESFLSTEFSYEKEISSLEDLPGTFSAILRSGLKEQEFTRIIIKDLEKERVITLGDFFSGINIETPEWLYEKLKENFTLLTYAPQNNQIALIMKIPEISSLLKQKEEEDNIRKRLKIEEEIEEERAKIVSLMNEWKKTIVRDFDPLFSVMGKESLYTAHVFIEVTRSGKKYHYTTFAYENFGLAYSAMEDYLMISTSERSIIELVDHKCEITQQLQLGDRGVEVEILQNWLAKDTKLYPDGLITGYYGYLTMEAVKRFQQKFSEEILKPWGRVEGTGRVDEVTREKLNEVYSK
jgi:hypothetical protein